MLEQVSSWTDTLLNQGSGLITWGKAFASKYANALLLIFLVLAISKVTSKNSLKVNV